MGRYNDYFKSHWSGCRLLAEARDLHRNRDVKIYMVPGEFDVVGVSDGTDSWVAPVSIDPFSVSVKRLLNDIREGKNPAPVRRAITKEVPNASQGAQTQRRRITLSPDHPQLKPPAPNHEVPPTPSPRRRIVCT